MTLADSRCPACGAPAEPKEGPCPHCAAPLHPLRCAWCFRWGFGEGGCRCGAALAAPAKPLPCPSCAVPLAVRRREKIALAGCGACGGVWAEAESFKRLCEDKAAQTAFAGVPGEGRARPDPSAAGIRYRPCPACGELMNRANFASSSGVVVDVCAKHGTWLDVDELAAVVAFIRDGGLDKARAREIERLELERRRLEALKGDGPPPPVFPDKRSSAVQSLERWLLGL